LPVEGTGRPGGDEGKKKIKNTQKLLFFFFFFFFLKSFSPAMPRRRRGKRVLFEDKSIGPAPNLPGATPAHPYGNANTVSAESSVVPIDVLG
jgi:hypothetical protein